MTRARNSANLASHGNLFVDITNDRTGIGSVVPEQNLHVAGTAGFHDDVTFTGNAYNTTWDRSDNSLKFADNAKLKFGTGNDANIRHDGNNTWIHNSTGYLYIDATNIRIFSQSHWQNGAMAAFYNNASVVLYHDANQKFQTTAYGINVTGTTDTDGLVVSGVATVTTMNVTGVLTYDDVTSVDSVGIVTARQGVHIDDSIVHIGDTNTKIRFPAADTITAETGGSERVRITSNGLVGINTNSPATQLHVTNSANCILLLEDTDSANQVGVRYKTTTGEWIAGVHGGQGNAWKLSNHSAFGTNDYLQVNTNGSVNIFANLTITSVNPSVYFNDSGSNPDYRLYNNGGSFKLKDTTNAVDRLIVDSSGRLLLGTTTEGHNNSDDLTIATTGHTGITLRSGTSNNGSLFFSDGTSGTDEYRGWVQYTHTSDYLTFGTGASERLRIDNAGNMGLGGDPIVSGYTSFTIHESGTGSGDHARFNMTTGTTGNTGSDGFSITVNGSTNAVHYIQRENADMAFQNSGGERIRIKSNGRIGVGNFTSINPARAVHIHEGSSGAVYATFTNTTTGTSASNGFTLGIDSSEQAIFNNYSSTDIIVIGNGSERFRISQAGQTTITSGGHDKGLDILPLGNQQETRLRIQAKNSSGTAHTFTLGAKQSGNRMDIYGTGPICFLTNPVGIHNTTPESPLTVGADTNPHVTNATVFVAPSSGDGSVHIRGGSPTLYFDSTSGGSGKILMDAADLVMNSGSMDNNGTELFRFTSGGRIGIGTGAPVNGIDIRNQGINVYSTGGSVRYQLAVTPSDGVSLVSKNSAGSYNNYKIDAGNFIVRTTGTNSPAERFKIDGNGNIQHNSAGSGISYFTGSSEYVFGSSTSSPPSGGPEGNFQFHSHKTRVTVTIGGYMNNAGAPILQFLSSRSGTPGTLGTKAAINDYHGDIRFMGDNGTNNNSLVQSAQILVRQKSTISDGDTVCAGEMSFYTGTDSAGSILERLRIDSGGRLTLLNSEGIKLSAKTSLLYAQDGSLSFYATNNGVYLNGPGTAGYLRLNASGVSNDRCSININGQTSGNADTIFFRTSANERMRINANGLVNIHGGSTGGNLHVGQDGATANFTDSNNGNTKHIEIGATGGGDALLTTHSSGYGVAYFGYEAGGDRCVIACDDGGGNNKIDFITNAGTSTGGNGDNLNNKHPKMRVKSGSGGVEIFVHQSATDGQPKHDVTALLLQNGIGGGDIGNSSEPTHIDWHWVDSNTNVTPQCRISGHVGDGGDPNTQAKEGKGFLTFHCSDTAGTSGSHDPGQRLRISHNGTFTGSSSNNISDQRLKENIAMITDPIAKIKALKGRTFTWKSEASMREGTHYGFIAQEIETVIPDLIVEDTGIRIFDKDDNLLPNSVYTPPVGGGYAKSVDADGVTPVLVEALKEALTRIETLEAEVAALKSS